MGLVFNFFQKCADSFLDGKRGLDILSILQGEGGINIASKEYLETIRRLCDENGAVMILDEV